NPPLFVRKISLRLSSMATLVTPSNVLNVFGCWGSDRSIRRTVSVSTRPEDLARPGHVFPLRSRPGGVLERRGHTEAAVDLASLAGLGGSGVICEILNKDGSMARVPELIRFCHRHRLKMIAIADLVRYRCSRESDETRLAAEFALQER